MCSFQFQRTPAPMLAMEPLRYGAALSFPCNRRGPRAALRRPRFPAGLQVPDGTQVAQNPSRPSRRTPDTGIQGRFEAFE